MLIKIIDHYDNKNKSMGGADSADTFTLDYPESMKNVGQP